MESINYYCYKHECVLQNNTTLSYKSTFTDFLPWGTCFHYFHAASRTSTRMTYFCIHPISFLRRTCQYSGALCARAISLWSGVRLRRNLWRTSSACDTMRRHPRCIVKHDKLHHDTFWHTCVDPHVCCMKRSLLKEQHKEIVIARRKFFVLNFLPHWILVIFAF